MTLKYLLSLGLATSAAMAVAAPYVVAPDGQTVRDNGNSLVWARCAVGMSLVNGACTGTANCQMIGNILYHSPELKNPTDRMWRLPTAWELNALLDESRNPGPMIDPRLFPNTPNTRFATNTNYNLDQKWGISFATGKPAAGGIAAHCARLVMGPINEGTGWKYVPRRTGGF